MAMNASALQQGRGCERAAREQSRAPVAEIPAWNRARSGELDYVHVRKISR
jgi:hypothetical protein